MTGLPFAETHGVFCAQCLTHRVQYATTYLCPACDDTPRPASWPPPRLSLDRPISTTAGEA